MRRKYDSRNKRNFIIILILSLIIICIFSLFIHKYREASKIMYVVETGSIVQDVNKNYVTTDEDAVLRIRWNKNYYLMYQDQKINLGKKVIVYNTVTGTMKLYGDFYEISDDGKVTLHSDETVLDNTNTAKFYKLADREYLLVSKAIVSDDSSINTNDYLLVELDKLGNAKLSNHTLNLKTVSATTLGTTEYRFDVANEKLIFDKLNVDLKKIIGSTNEYAPEEEKEETDDKNKQRENETTWNSSGNGGGVNNNTESGTVTDIEELKKKAKMTSIVSVRENINSIEVHYVIYDPYDEYKSVYAEITKERGIEIVHLDKSQTQITFNDLKPNKKYPIVFKYTTLNSEGKLEPHEFENMDNLRTKMPNFEIVVSGISSSNILKYKVTSKDNYPVSNIRVRAEFYYDTYDDGNLTVHDNGKKYDSEPRSINEGATSVFGTIDLSDYNINNDNDIKLILESVTGADGTLEVNKKYSFRLAG